MDWSSVVGAAIGALFGSLATGVIAWTISENKNKLDLGLATWSERTQAHREIYAAYIRLNAYLHKLDTTREKREVIESAFVTYRNNAIFLDEELSDEVHAVFVLMRSYKRSLEAQRGTGQSASIQEQAERIKNLGIKLRQSAGATNSSKFVRSKLKA